MSATCCVTVLHLGETACPNHTSFIKWKKKPKTPNSKKYRLMPKVTKIWQFSVTTFIFGNQQFLHFIFMKLMQRDCVTHAMLVPALHLTYSSAPQTPLWFILTHKWSFPIWSWVILKDFDSHFIVFCQVQFQPDLTGFLDHISREQWGYGGRLWISGGAAG